MESPSHRNHQTLFWLRVFTFLYSWPPNEESSIRSDPGRKIGRRSPPP